MELHLAPSPLVLVPLGLAAGALTTVAGLGGGLFLVLSLSVLFGPTTALAVTAPALLLSNAHRAALFRADIDGPVARVFALSAAPAALAMALVVARVPRSLVQAAMLALTGFALLRATGIVRYVPRPGAFAPLSALVGALSAGAGAGGFLVAPLLLSVGLTGSRYVATGAACAVALHVARVVGYGSAGLLHASLWVASAWLFGGLALGNLAGRRLRGALSPRAASTVELGALTVCTTLGVLGFA